MQNLCETVVNENYTYMRIYIDCIGGDTIKTILIVEDDKALSNGICIALKSDEIILEQCFNIKSACSKIAQRDFDLILLDINLPDGSGLDFLYEIKKNKSIPVILLTANDMETDIVTGLESGADDYITKPFSLAVLRARVNTQLRKAVPPQSLQVTIDSFIFDFETMRYEKNDKPIELSKTEQRLLKVLVDNKGTTLQRDTLVDRIWTDGAEYVDENALSVTIKRLRDKLEDTPAKPQYIKTIYGVGYTWMVVKDEAI